MQIWIFKNIFSSLRGYWQSTSGQFAIYFALAAALCLLAAGVAIDTGGSFNQKTRMQDQLDAALLVAIHENDAEKAKQVAVSRLGEPGFEVGSFTFSEQGLVRTVSANMTSNHANTLMGIFGKKTTALKVMSEVRAPLQVSDVRLNPTSAHGWYRKHINLMVERPDKTEHKLADYKWLPMGVDALKPGVMTGQLTSTHTGWIPLGDFERVWLEMKVFDTGGYLNNNMAKSLYGAKQSFAIDDPQYSDHLYVNGVRLPKGETVKLTEMFPCDVQSSHAWEDLGRPGTSDHDVQDFFFDVEVQCNRIDPEQVAIKR